MTSLFRPWTEDGGTAEKNATKVYTTDWLGPPGSSAEFPSGPTGQEIGDNGSGAPADGDNDNTDRHLRYKRVREHARKRSEKYGKLKKSGVVRTGAGAEAESPPVVFANLPFDPRYPVPVLSDPMTDLYAAAAAAGDVAAGVVPVGTTGGGPYGHGGPTDWLEAAFVHGFPPNLFEEYARFLTEQQKQVAERTRKQRPKKFRCPHCQVGFSNNGQLKGHIRIHTGERPFKCDAESCGKSFTRNEELTRHRRIHSGLRPFPCSECGKRFGRKDHLKKHVKTHFQQRYQLVPILPSHCPYLYGL